MILKKVRAWIERHALLTPGDSVLVACSGGHDSLALVHILNRLKSEYDLKMAVGHVDHMFRGAESARDAEFVAEFCAEIGVPCYVKAIDVPAFIKKSGKSRQEAARILRYGYLREVAQSRMGGAKIATAHHMDDHVETVLINLLRGAGSDGLRGIKPSKNGIIRPLLGVRREEIEAYCLEHRLKPRIDQSNFKTDYLRNRIRLELLPYLEEKYNPAIKEALNRMAGIIGDQHDFLSRYAVRVWDKLIEDGRNELIVRTDQLVLEHIAVQREIIRMVLEKKRRLTGITFYHVERLLEMAVKGRVGAVMPLPGGYTAQKSYGILKFFKDSENKALAHKMAAAVVKIPGVTKVPELGLTITAEVADETAARLGADAAVFDYDQVQLPVCVRTREAGDRFFPLGLGGSKKVKDFLIDLKVPREKREMIPIFYDRQGIIWVGGYRQDERCKITGRTRRMLKLTIEQEDYT